MALKILVESLLEIKEAVQKLTYVVPVEHMGMAAMVQEHALLTLKQILRKEIHYTVQVLIIIQLVIAVHAVVE